MTLTTRCVQCRAEFSDAELAGANACPKCGTNSLPMAIADDVTIRINWHELRILAMWADEWMRTWCGESERKTLHSILGALRAQHPDLLPLTIEEELQEVADEVGDLEVIGPGESQPRTIKARRPS